MNYNPHQEYTDGPNNPLSDESTFVPDELKSLGYGDVSILNGKLYYRYDFDSCCVDDNPNPDDHKYHACEELKDLGWKIDEPYLEHDCLTGYLKRI